jgi:adenosylhomocysteine nucleosidase
MSVIGIIGAMDEEVSALISKVEIIQVKNIINTDFHMGQMLGNTVIVVKSGIGKVNAAICTQVLIDMYGVDYVINTGVAGAISSNLNIGDIVISKDLVHHDFDSLDGAGVISRMDESFFKGDDALISLAKLACQSTLKENAFFVERIATGDIFVQSKELKEKIFNQFKAFCTEMEGAAIAQTCYLNKIPFVAIRSISDKSDETAQVSFEKFVIESAEKNTDIIQYIIEKIKDI